MSLFFWLLVALFAYWLYKRSRKKKARIVPPPRRGLDEFVEEVIASELSRRTAVDKDLALSTLRGAPEPAVVSSIEEAVREVELKFVHTPLGDLELTVEVRFEKGLPVLRTKRLERDEVPEDVRVELQQKGGTMLFRKWAFPWGR
jgi:hypothetical protein